MKMKKHILRVIAVVAISLSACSNQQATQEMNSDKLIATAFNDKLNNVTDATLLDVRTPNELKYR